MKYPLLCTLLCFGCTGFFQTVQADPVLLSYNYTPINVPGSTSTTALGLNNSGQIVGSYTDATGTHGFLDTNNAFTTLSFLPTGINNVGQIVGYSSNGVVLDTNGAITNIAAPGFASPNRTGDFAPPLARINDLGQIAGSYLNQQYNPQAFVYSNGAFTFLPISVDSTVVTKSINNAGQILVTATFGFGNPNAYVYQNGSYDTVSQNVQRGVGINNTGEIVTAPIPAVDVFQNGALTGYFFPPYVGPYDLNDSGQLLFATVLATPATAAVPEPASVLLFASGLAGMGLLLRRKTV
jgi:hypothetical protein